jgi:hypothetical protein
MRRIEYGIALFRVAERGGEEPLILLARVGAGPARRGF